EGAREVVARQRRLAFAEVVDAEVRVERRVRGGQRRRALQPAQAVGGVPAVERGEALAHEPREKPTLLALVERDYALADLVAATLGLVEIFPPVARAPGGLDRSAADVAGLVQNVNERVQ